MNSHDIKILFVTSHWPYAPSYGAQLRVLNIGKLLKRIGKVSLVIAPYGAIDEENFAKTRKEFDVKHIAQLTPINLRNAVDRVRHEFDPSFLNTQGVEVLKNDRDTMLRMIDEHDVIWVHTIHTTNIFGIYRWPHTVLDVDDIQSRLYASKAKAGSDIIRSLLDYRMSLIWYNRERIFKKRFDMITVCSDDDRRYFGNNRKVWVIPNGFNPPSGVPIHAPTIPPRIGFIGTLNWLPNKSGVEWFIGSVWPLIKSDVPTARLRLVGEGTDSHYPDPGSDIDGLGWVEDPGSEIASWSAMIVPVHMGGGTRVKIAEAFSKKCPVVSTSLGAFGYEVLNGEDLLLADNVQDFASACLRLLKDKQLGLKLSENAWKKFLKRWTWDSIGEEVSIAVRECLSKK